MKKLTVVLILIFLLNGCKSPVDSEIKDRLKPVIVKFTIMDEAVLPGSMAFITWETLYATTVRILPGIGNVEAEGQIRVYPEHETTYELTAENSLGKTTATCTVSMLLYAKVEITLIQIRITYLSILRMLEFIIFWDFAF